MSHLYLERWFRCSCTFFLTTSFPSCIFLGKKTNREISPTAKETWTGTRKYLEAWKKKKSVFLVMFFLWAVRICATRCPGSIRATTQLAKKPTELQTSDDLFWKTPVRYFLGISRGDRGGVAGGFCCFVFKIVIIIIPVHRPPGKAGGVLTPHKQLLATTDVAVVPFSSNRYQAHFDCLSGQKILL